MDVTEESSSDFPMTIRFGDGTVLNFETREDFDGWVEKEMARGRTLVAANEQGPRHTISQQIRMLERFAKSISEASEEFLKSFVPFTGLFGQAVERASKGDIAVAAMATAMYIDGAANRNFGHPLVVQGQSIVSGFLVAAELMRDASALRNGAAEALAAKDAYRAEAERMKAVASQADTDWEKRIEGYELKVALGAPKAYWTERAKEHARLAEKARASWSRWMIGLGIASLVLVVLLFTEPGQEISIWLDGKVHRLLFGSSEIQFPSVEPNAYARIIPKLVIFATFAGLGLWWLKQKLRDLRSHEHLAEDAKERITMIETYSALKGQGLEAEGLNIILGALYRPANTGLISDNDGAPAMPWDVALKAIGSK